MRKSRPSRIVAALVALFSVLFMQFAVAAYACPTLHLGQANDTMDMSADVNGMATMSGCAGVDIEKPNLCQADSHKGKLSLDKPELPNVPSFAPAQLLAIVIPVHLSIPSAPSTSPAGILARTTAPPLSIRHCCFRI
ncbi:MULTISPECIES: hypothetical protein [Noviherbaspirillum]|jgi:hypothetical protein|uniref:Uncharacterized protein n=1 Tax=Noviherbaspirillum album TaxID=3080276 RepID=A0ABU6JHA1_9BURK|nr:MULTISPECIES: hypothetical protein [Noviherbaspirillum]MEC4722856.1 hypothetical protein [Noviherbaspirillum sp. CPCC 100848]